MHRQLSEGSALASVPAVLIARAMGASGSFGGTLAQLDALTAQFATEFTAAERVRLAPDAPYGTGVFAALRFTPDPRPMFSPSDEARMAEFRDEASKLGGSLCGERLTRD